MTEQSNKGRQASEQDQKQGQKNAGGVDDMEREDQKDGGEVEAPPDFGDSFSNQKHSSPDARRGSERKSDR